MKKILPLLFACAATAASAQHYARLDTAFNNNGIVVLDTPIQSLPQITFKHALQSDGKIVLCGNKPTGFFVTEVTVARLKPNGTFDSTFGLNGIQSFPVSAGGFNYAVGLAIQPDGKIVTGGTVSDGINPGQLFIARLNANGTMDAAFGSGGIGIYDVNEENERVTDLKLQPNGKILMSGIAATSSSSDSGFILRILSNGSVDNSFALNGVFRYQQDDNQTDLYSIAADSNGKIVAGGSYYSNNNYQDFLLIRLDSNGMMDNTFGSGGVFTNDYFRDYDEIHSVKILSNHSVIAAGYSYNGNNDGVATIKLTAAGTLDATFGTAGRTYIGDSMQPMRGYSMQMQTDGKVVIGGNKSDSTGLNNFLLLRLTANGLADTSFSPGNGYITTDFFGDEDRIHSLTIQTDGKILAYGTAIRNVSTQEEQPVLARYVTTVTVTPPPPPPTAVQALAVSGTDIRLYPSPVTGSSLHIATRYAHAYVCYLYTSTGMLVQQVSLPADDHTLLLSPGLADGVYFLMLKDVADNSVSRHAVVIRRNY